MRRKHVRKSVFFFEYLPGFENALKKPVEEVNRKFKGGNTSSSH